MLLDRSGELLQELRVDYEGRRLRWTPLEDISPAVADAVVFAEDRRFYWHQGVDWKALGYAAFSNLWSGRRRGASTITMQLVPMLSEKKPKGKRSLSQKWRQIQEASEIERTWSKRQILEAYLNLVTFRSELQGIDAAAWGLFGKKPSGLTEEESLLLTALIPSPNAVSAAVASRACSLARMSGSTVRCGDITELARERLSPPFLSPPHGSVAYHAAVRLLGKETPRVVSSIDGNLQRFVAETLRHHLTVLRHRNVRDGAALVADNETGEILAYAGIGGLSPETRFVDGTRAYRQAGSTLKPFLYALAFERRLLTASSLMEDARIEVPTARGLYVPKNYDNRYLGLISARTALSSSVNIPAVRVLELIGSEDFADRLRRLGFSGIREQGDFYGHSLALGTADVTLTELVNAYRTLANLGLRSDLSLVPVTGKPRMTRVMDAGSSFITSDILADREARHAVFGYESTLSTKFRTSVKTGTSKDMRDNWCIGFSGKYTVGVWVGNLNGDPMWNVSGISGAAPVWLDIMNRLHRSVKSRPQKPPQDVVTAAVTFREGIEPDRRELFLSGTEISVIGETPKRDRPRIISPADSSVIALDPDIPDDRQRVLFEAVADKNGHRWVLDGQPAGAAAEPFLWNPLPGQHVLSLINTRGRTVDTVFFSVRGKGADSVRDNADREVFAERE